MLSKEKPNPFNLALPPQATRWRTEAHFWAEAHWLRVAVYSAHFPTVTVGLKGLPQEGSAVLCRLILLSCSGLLIYQVGLS